MAPCKIYDFFKFVALVLLPGSGALYATLASIWGLPAAVEVSGSIAALDMFLGLAISRMSKLHTDKVGSAPVVGEVTIGLDQDGLAEIQRIRQTVEGPIVFTPGQPVMFDVKMGSSPNPH